MIGKWSHPTLIASLAVLPVGAVIAAAPAYACTADDDVNVLCSNEQAFINDLAAVGVTPTQTPRIMVNRGQGLCGQLASGASRSYVVQLVYASAAMSLDQARAIVAAAENHLCYFNSTGFTPNP